MVNIAKAQALMTDPNFWSNVDSVEKSKHGGKKSISYESNMAPNVNTMMYEQQQQMQYNNYGRNNKPNFSQDIMESFNAMPPIECDNGLMSELPASFIEGASNAMSNMGGIPTNMIPRQQVTNRGVSQPVMVNETMNQGYMQMPQQMPDGGGINYNYLKFFIMEAVKECVKPMLNETRSGNEFRGLVMRGGNKIQLLDRQGNLYEAELKLKKRANEK